MTLQWIGRALTIDLARTCLQPEPDGGFTVPDQQASVRVFRTQLSRDESRSYRGAGTVL